MGGLMKYITRLIPPNDVVIWTVTVVMATAVLHYIQTFDSGCLIAIAVCMVALGLRDVNEKA